MAFDALNEALNTNYIKEEPKEDLKNLPSLSTASNLPTSAKSIEDIKISLKNKAFVQSEIVSLVDECRQVLSHLKEELMIEGTRASQFTAFTELVTSTGGLLHELNLMDQVENELELKANTVNAKKNSLLPVVDPDKPSMTITQSITLTGAEMIEQLIEMRKNAEINDIDTVFNYTEADKVEVNV